MPERPYLCLVRIEPPTFKCSACEMTFVPTSDSLRQVLRDFRSHLTNEHREDVLLLFSSTQV